MFPALYFQNGYWAPTYFPDPAALVAATAAAPVELPYWADQQFGHLFDLWERTQPGPGPHGNLPGFGWVKRAAGVRGFHFVRPSSSDTSDIGSMEEDIALTRDVFCLPNHTEIKEGWVIVEKSVEPDGSNADNYGFGWACRGMATSNANTEALDQMGYIEVRGSVLPALPNGVTVQ